MLYCDITGMDSFLIGVSDSCMWPELLPEPDFPNDCICLCLVRRIILTGSSLKLFMTGEKRIQSKITCFQLTGREIKCKITWMTLTGEAPLNKVSDYIESRFWCAGKYLFSMNGVMLCFKPAIVPLKKKKFYIIIITYPSPDLLWNEWMMH